MEQIISNRISAWSNPPFDQAASDEIKKLVSENSSAELKDRFYRNLEFGTGGLRGVVAAGTNRMNIYTVGMAAQGLADYIVSSGKSDRGIVIARDSRIMSDVFAWESAVIMASNGIKVYYFNEITPTPIASFAIRELGAAAGIVITASHNPPEYNGFKVFWSDGGQIVSPQDEEIIRCVADIDSPKKIIKAEADKLLENRMITYIDKSMKHSYIGFLAAKISPRRNVNIKIAYTPLHGAGAIYIPEVMNYFGYTDLHIVNEQSAPDGRFPTVASPNPEDPKAMKMVLELAEKIDADIALATDPDADRMGVAVRNSGGYTLLSGNQIGTLLEYYILSRASESGAPLDSSYIVKTIVTTDLQTLIAEDFGCRVFEVLTGFKWIASVIAENENKGLKFLFGGEESFGYLAYDRVRDKDAVSSSLLFAEMTAYLKGKGLTPMDWLDIIYEKFGMFLDDSFSITIKGMEGSETIRKIMTHFRSSIPEAINGNRVVKVVDYMKQIEIDPASGNTSPMINILPESDVLQFFLADGAKISMRPSGTEPKIKFYLSVNRPVQGRDSSAVKKELLSLLDNYKGYLNCEIGQVS